MQHRLGIIDPYLSPRERGSLIQRARTREREAYRMGQLYERRLARALADQKFQDQIIRRVKHICLTVPFDPEEPVHTAFPRADEYATKSLADHLVRERLIRRKRVNAQTLCYEMKVVDAPNTGY